MRAFKVTGRTFWKLIIVPGQSSQLFAALTSVNHLNVESKEFEIQTQNLFISTYSFLVCCGASSTCDGNFGIIEMFVLYVLDFDVYLPGWTKQVK